METDLPAIAKALRALDKSDVKNWLRRGELLTQAKDLAPTETAFKRWLGREKIAKTTAYKAMAAWRDFSSVPTSGQFSKEAMAILAQCPEARTAAVEISERGPVTAATARKLVRQHAMLPTLAEQLQLAEETPGFIEVLDVDGITITITARTRPTEGDLFGAMVTANRMLRDRLKRAA